MAPVKFALEVGNIHPHAVDVNESSKEEDCLAKTLLDRLGIPDSPVVADEYEKEANEVIPVSLEGTEATAEEKPAIEESAEVVAGE